MMDKDNAMQKALALADEAEIVMLGTNGEDGYPHIKAMLKMENKGLKTIWFSTNTASKRIPQLKQDSRVCVYFVDFDDRKGLMLVGDIEILQDKASRERIWREGNEMYYPLGIDDPDYSVLRFTAKWGNYYHALDNLTFEL
jgi:general stress protein 26